jgi:tRNA nucleotidyltransferase (CCA-adding enzyme)
MASPTPEKILRLARAVGEAGGRALLVGGCVRDRLMGREVKDWDVEVYGVEPADLRLLLARFGRVNVVGEAFTVYKLGQDVDVSIPRRERKTGRGHQGFYIEGDPSMSFEQAARRRDFTVNAILEDPLADGEIIDPYRGREDIDAGLLRAIAPDTFVEDSLRVLRAAQFAARFGFDVEPATVELCRSIDLTDLPAERVWGELEKILLAAPRPSVGLAWLDRLNVTPQLFPALDALKGVRREPDSHPEEDVFVHTQLVCDRVRELVDDLDYARRVTLMLSALCHDFGKPLTNSAAGADIPFLGHEELGVLPTGAFLDWLKVFTLDGYDVRKQVVALVGLHLKPGEFYHARDGVTDGDFRRLARRCELGLLYRLAKADSLCCNAPWAPREKWFDAGAQEWFIARARELSVEEGPPAQILLGRHLLEMGLKPSPLVGRIQRAVYELQLDGSVRTLEEAKAAARELLEDSRGGSL